MKHTFGKMVFAVVVCILCTLCSSNHNNLQAQTPPSLTTDELSGRVNAVFSSIPFLRINPDGRTGGMGDVGIALPGNDAAAIYHNAARLAFADQPYNVGSDDRDYGNDMGLALTYTPWLQELVDDIFIAHLSGYKMIGSQVAGTSKASQAIGLSLRYFSLGNIQFTDLTGSSAGEYNPNEFAIDLAYARRLSSNFSLGATLKYARSDLASGQQVGSGNIIKAAQAIAADISFYYQNDDMRLGNKDFGLSWGLALSNIGNKVSYTEDDVKDFIPVNLGLGVAGKLNLDDYNSITLAYDINKLLVPTPPAPDENGVVDDSYRDRSLLDGIFSSFGDAPGGFSEEVRELMHSVGLEYWYNNQFAVRAGYFHEHATKGNRQFVTLGLGLKYSIFGLNFSYLIPTTVVGSHPLSNTLRFSAVFDFAKAD